MKPDLYTKTILTPIALCPPPAPDASRKGAKNAKIILGGRRSVVAV